MAKTFKHLTKSDRIKMEALLKAGHSKAEIAEQLHVHRSTVYREIKRGVYTALNSDLTQEERYSPDIADDKYKENLKSKGGVLKIGNDIKLANYIENKIINDGYSPAAVLGELKAKNREGEFSVTICVTTLYSYIDKGIFLRLTNKDLPVKANKKRDYKKVKRQQARAAAGTSIEKRPEEVNSREEFGHWEMDSVIGQRGKSKNTLLVLTERKTRDEIIFKLPDKTAEWGVAFADLHTPMRNLSIEIQKENDRNTLTVGDCIHPALEGHWMMVYEILTAQRALSRNDVMEEKDGFYQGEKGMCWSWSPRTLPMEQDEGAVCRKVAHPCGGGYYGVAWERAAYRCETV